MTPLFFFNQAWKKLMELGFQKHPVVKAMTL